MIYKTWGPYFVEEEPQFSQIDKMVHMQVYNTSSERLFKRIVVRVCESKPNNDNNNNNNNNDNNNNNSNNNNNNNKYCVTLVACNACCNARETHVQYNCIYQEAVILT